jgi:uncharacterized Zn finger protein
MIETVIIWTPEPPEATKVDSYCPCCGSRWEPDVIGKHGREIAECPDCGCVDKWDEWYK